LKTFDWKSILIDNQLKIIDCLKNQSKPLIASNINQKIVLSCQVGLKILKYGFWGLMAWYDTDILHICNHKVYFGKI